jgi:hypothetical protein
VIFLFRDPLVSRPKPVNGLAFGEPVRRDGKRDGVLRDGDRRIDGDRATGRRRIEGSDVKRFLKKPIDSEFR